MTSPDQARRIRERMEAIPPGKKNTAEDPYWVRSAVRHWKQQIRLAQGGEETETPLEKSQQYLAELEGDYERYMNEGCYEGMESVGE